jgi:Ig-like domain from next to BRCA1 gene
VIVRKFALLTMLFLTLAACRGGGAAATDTPAPAPTSTTAPSAATVPSQPTITPQPSPTLPPTATQAQARPSATSAEAGVTPPETGAATETPTAAPGETGGSMQAEFVDDVTVPDGMLFAPGETFVKTWKIKNSGTAVWGADYALVYVRGEQMGGPDTQPLPGPVAAGADVDLSLDLTAPSQVGSYTGFWMLRAPDGSLFGIGPEANAPIYVQIQVAPAGSTPQPTAAAGPIKVTAAVMSLEEASFTGACPHTFEFRGSFTSEGSGQVSYRLEAESDKEGFAFNLPDPVNSIFANAGPRTFGVTYDLQFTDSVSGRVWLHVLTPDDLESDKVDFSLTCQ